MDIHINKIKIIVVFSIIISNLRCNASLNMKFEIFIIIEIYYYTIIDFILPYIHRILFFIINEYFILLNFYFYIFY